MRPHLTHFQSPKLSSGRTPANVRVGEPEALRRLLLLLWTPRLFGAERSFLKLVLGPLTSTELWTAARSLLRATPPTRAPEVSSAPQQGACFVICPRARSTENSRWWVQSWLKIPFACLPSLSGDCRRRSRRWRPELSPCHRVWFLKGDRAF